MFQFIQELWLGTIANEINHRKQIAKLPISHECIESANLGVICVVGDESSGKSSVLRRLLQLPIFEVGPDLITRHVLRLKLVYCAEHTTPHMIFMVPGKRTIESTSVQEIHDALKASHADVQHSGVGISDIEAVLEISSNLYPNIEIIDTPGLLSHAQEDEPENLPMIAKTIVQKYILKPNCIVLFIGDGRANLRNSPSMALLKELKPETVIKVITKIDCLVDMRQPNGPLAGFLETFGNEAKYCIALSNYASKLNATFDEITNEEELFFKNNLNYKDMKHKVGITSLLQVVNQIAERNSRHKWAESQCSREKKELENFEVELMNMGPELKTEDILSQVTMSLLGDDMFFDKMIDKAWIKSSFVLPNAGTWHEEANIDICKFLQNFESELLSKIKTIFATHVMKLHRFATFAHGFETRLHEKIQERTDAFMKRWAQLAHKIQLDHDTLENYSPKQWLHGTKCCLSQTILMNLKETPKGPQPPNLQMQIYLLMQDLSCEESEDVRILRSSLQLKIKTIKEIIQLLPSNQL